MDVSATVRKEFGDLEKTKNQEPNFYNFLKPKPWKKNIRTIKFFTEQKLIFYRAKVSFFTEQKLRDG
jgi:hypothetical protein